MATNATPETVLLRAKGGDKSEPFTPAHAKRLLAYPGTLWSEVASESKAPAKAIEANKTAK